MHAKNFYNHLVIGMQKKVAYLAPEIPALSATFVYEEINAMRSVSIDVLPVSIRPPGVVANSQRQLIIETKVLYSKRRVRDFLSGFFNVLASRGCLKALGWLCQDLKSVGIFSTQSLKLAYQFVFAGNLALWLKKSQVKHLHIHFAHVPTQIGMYASALTGIPYTVTAHANDIFERALLLKEKAIRSSGFFTISEYNRNYLLSLGLPSGKLEIVRCGVGYSREGEGRRFEKKQKYHLGVVGRLVEKKGLDVLIDAIRQLIDENQDVELTIAGDGPLRDELQSAVKSKGLENKIKFIGNLSHEKIPDFLQSLDLFVLPCKKDKNGDMDGIPVVLMEAMLYGVPVVSTKISGIPELVIDGTTGLLAIPGEAEDLKRKIKECVDFPEKTQLRQANAIRHVQSEFNQMENAKKLIYQWGFE